MLLIYCISVSMGFPGGSVVKNLPSVQEIQVRSPGQEDPPGEGNGNPFQYSCLVNPMDRGAWWAVVHSVTKNGTHLSGWARMHICFCISKTVLTPKIEFSSSQLIPFIHFILPHHLFPSSNYYSALCIPMLVFVWLGLSISLWFLLSYEWNEWNHMVFVFLHLTYFT